MFFLASLSCLLFCLHANEQISIQIASNFMEVTVIYLMNALVTSTGKSFFRIYFADNTHSAEHIS